MKLKPHLSFNGQCQEAMDFYQRCLGAKIHFMLTYGNAPMSDRVPPEWRGKILHATLAIGRSILNAADATPEHYQPPKGFHLTIDVQDAAEAERIFRELSEGGSVQMPLQKTFWATHFGVAVDRFGIPWEVNCPGASE
ncbi:MAG TPA: VOC family protein [Tepidisphaeraceae bacterium]|nr:VOC family protein [Tepidisphaeraceae bacterium]